MVKRLVCPKCGKKDSPVLINRCDRRFDLPYNMCADSDFWYDLVVNTEEDEGQADCYCCYCNHEGVVRDFEVEGNVRDFEVEEIAKELNEYKVYMKLEGTFTVEAGSYEEAEEKLSAIENDACNKGMTLKKENIDKVIFDIIL